jgi:N-acetylneuraminate synthase/sialic acid synthase
VNDENPAYVIAEVGHNHQGKLETAKEMFRQAQSCGVSAVKLQKRDNRTLFTKAAFDKAYENENSFGATYGEHREALEFGREEYAELKGYAAELGLDFFATAFDIRSADFLEALGMPAYKIASADLRNLPLLRHVAAFGKPVVVSTGGGTMEDVERAYDTVMAINTQLCIMQCTCGYPVEFDELNLRAIETFRQRFPDIVVGYSGHDNGIAMPVVSYVLGARVIEKHFTLNRAMKGTDNVFSLEPVGMRKMTRDLERARLSLGDGKKVVFPSETGPVLKMGKKLVAARDLPAGHTLSSDDIAVKSPGDGLAPVEIDRVIGLVTKVALTTDDALSLEQLAREG